MIRINSNFLSILTTISALSLFQSAVVHADTSERQQAQAMQFGLLFGGIATQYDECTRQGLAPSGERSAEAQADQFLKTSEQFTNDKAGYEYAHKGWDMAKQKILELPPEFWTKNCQSIAKQWNKYSAMFKLR